MSRSYGKILGRLVVVRRGKSRKGTKSGNCVGCGLPVVEGTAHFVLMRSWKPKPDPSKKPLWFTRRFHFPCFPKWLEPAEEWLIENERKANAKRTGRPRAVLSKLGPEQLVERLRMIKRRGYLIRRLLGHPQYDQETREGIELEVRTLAKEIDAIEPSRRFATRKRAESVKAYQEVTGSPPDTGHVTTTAKKQNK